MIDFNMKAPRSSKTWQPFFAVVFLCFVYVKPTFCIPQNVQIISVNDVLFSETGYIYLPAKPLGKLYLANYDYNKKEKKLTLSKRKSYITFWLNSTKAERNGETINVKFPVKMIKSQIFVPVRDVQNTFDPHSQLDMFGYGITIIIGNRILIADESQESIYSYSGSFYASAKMWEKALENYKLAQKLNPADLWLQDYIITCYFNMGNYRTALKEYKKLQAMRIKGKYTLFNSQWDNELGGKLAIESKPAEKSVLEQARAFSLEGDWDKAIALYEQYIKSALANYSDPEKDYWLRHDIVRSTIELAKVYMKAGQNEKAQQICSDFLTQPKFIKRKEDEGPFQACIAKTFINERKYDAAIEQLENFVAALRQEYPSYTMEGDLALIAGVAYFHKGDYEKAIEYFKKTPTYFDNYHYYQYEPEEYINYRIDAYAKAGKIQEAINILDYLYEKNRSNEKGEIYLEKIKSIDEQAYQGKVNNKNTVPTTISQIQIDDEDNIYTLDAQMKRVWKVSPTGKIESWIGNSDFDTGPMKKPTSFAVDQNKTIFITDSGTHSIFIYDTSGNLKTRLSLPEYSKITHENIYLKKYSVPIRIAVTKDNIFILDMNLNWLLQLDMSGILVKRWDTDKDGTELFEHPLDMDVSDGKIFITDGQKKRIVVIGENGAMKSFPVKSEKKLNASIPLNLTIDKAGILSVLVIGHQEIMQFDVNGKFLGKRMIRYLDAKDIYDFLFTSTGETVWFLKEKQNENWREWYPVPYTPSGRLLVINKENKLKFSIPSGIAYPQLKDVSW